jgi:predicted CXXCH cytochrome family protein
VKGECTVCHQPHQADSAALLRNGDGPDHCYGCHAAKKQAMTQDAFVHKPASDSCTTCHGPHATDNAKQLKLPVNETCLSCHTKIKEQLATAKHVHGAVTEGNCASCHDPHASNNPDELKARTDKLCMTCHDKAIKTADGRTIASMSAVMASKNLHGPVKAGQCSACHLPHASDEPNLLKAYSPDTFYASFDVTLYALCFSCHNQQVVLQPKTTTLTNFRDGDTNLHYLHVNRADKGRTCKTCHDVHGSDLPNHIAASVPFEGSNWAMPINYEQTATGGSCTPACHDKKTYDRVQPAGTKPAAQPAASEPADRGGL